MTDPFVPDPSLERRVGTATFPSGSRSTSAAPLANQLAASPSVLQHIPFTSIYSRSDGVVDWRACLDPPAEHVVEVSTSHYDMGTDTGLSTWMQSGRYIAANFA